jgi:hypothetical protein
MSIFSELNSSAGSDGVLPAVSTSTFLTFLIPILQLMAERADNKSANPLSLARLKSLWIFGLRKSASIKNTFLSLWAMDRARLTATEVFPSPMSGLEIRIVFRGWPVSAKSIVVLKERNGSVIG